MNREHYSDIIGNIDDKLIAGAFRYDPASHSEASERSKHMKAKRIITLALAAALILALGVGAYAAVNGRRVQDLVLRPEEPADITLIGEDEIAIVGDTEITPQEEPSLSYDPLPGDVDMISLQGYAESPEYQAAQAWAEFEHEYDRDGAILNTVGNSSTPWDEKYSYNGYHVYSQEMADQVEAIAAEYGLQLHNGGSQEATMAELYARFGIFGKASDYNGYYYEDGTFQCDCTYEGLNFQLRRCMKGVLDTVGLNITDAESYEQWEYTTACGETVLLALGPGKALILADTAQSFVVVNVLSGTDSGLNAEDLQALADSIDFSIL